VELTGPDGLLTGLTKQVLETALEAELSDHLGYDKHNPAGRNRGNSRNGTRSKTVLTDIGTVESEVPRDRDGSFDPQVVRKRQRRLAGVSQMVLSLSARGLTTGEISAHFLEVYGARISKDTISAITDTVIEEMTEWRNRPLDRVYPVIFVDAITVKIRDGQVTNRPVYVAIGVTVDGERDILRFRSPYRSRIGVSWPVRPAGTARPPAAAPPAASGPSRATSAPWPHHGLHRLGTPSHKTTDVTAGCWTGLHRPLTGPGTGGRPRQARPPNGPAYGSRGARPTAWRGRGSRPRPGHRRSAWPRSTMALLRACKAINKSAGLASGGPAANTSNIRPAYACEQLLPQVRGIAPSGRPTAPRRAPKRPSS
jgi:hypothetical protein